MKVRKFLLLFYLVCFWVGSSLYAQSSYCKNISFELGNFSNWVGYTWRYSEAPDVSPSFNTNPVPGIVYRRQVIMSDTTEYDKNTGYALRKIPRGYKYSARLGDEIISGDGMPRCWQQSLRYTMTIDSSNDLLILKFALVLQYAITHNAINEPRFKLTLYDSQGNQITDCSNYDVYSSNKYVKGFKTYMPTGNNPVPVEWRDWTTVGANLQKYIGQTITIEFRATDCTEHYHYGYAYFIAECHPLYISVKYCASDTAATLIAPEGFEKYNWKNSSGATIDTVQRLSLRIPDQKSSYSCTMTSATGCVVTLQSRVVKYIPKADFGSLMLDCKSNTVQFINHSTTSNGALSYNWIFDDGNTSALRSPPYTFSTSGMHTVTLLLSNPPSTCTDTLTKDCESFSPPLVGINGDSTYCPGMSTTIKAYGAFDYTWSNGSKADTVKVSAPGGTYWLIGRSSTGCISDTIYKTIIEEPDWPFIVKGDTVICGNGRAILSASGAETYQWNRRVPLSTSGGNSFIWTKVITDDTIVTSIPGTYMVTGTNTRGCQKSETFNVNGYQLPAVDIKFSPEAIDRNNNTLICTSPALSDVYYAWNLGDGSSGSGPTVRHEYDISDTTLFYLIKLYAISVHGCTDSSSKYIDVVPFIPNVFSPNGDGINDVFMHAFKLEIVDRNGLQIYKGNNGWDGRQKGRPADPDTYFYLIYYKDSEQKIHTRKGYVTLIR